MSRSDDRIIVPTNGHHAPSATGILPGESPPSAPPPADDRSSGPARPDLRFAVTPGQAIMGFGILASLVLLFLGRRRGRGQPARRDR